MESPQTYDGIPRRDEDGRYRDLVRKSGGRERERINKEERGVVRNMINVADRERETEPVSVQKAAFGSVPGRGFVLQLEGIDRSIDRSGATLFSTLSRRTRSGHRYSIPFVIWNIVSNICPSFQFQIRIRCDSVHTPPSPHQPRLSSISIAFLDPKFAPLLYLPFSLSFLSIFLSSSCHSFVRIIRGSRAAICHAQIQEFAPSTGEDGPKKGKEEERKKEEGIEPFHSFLIKRWGCSFHVLRRVWNSLGTT